MTNYIKINYSICNYVPSIVRNESVIFGIVIHCPSEEYSKFYRTKNLKRLRAFDDEYDPDYIAMMSETFSYYFDYPELEFFENDQDRFDNIKSDSFISETTKFYVNEFKFSEVRELLTTKECLKNDIDDLVRTYLYYDKPKSERISTSEVKRLLSKELKNLSLKQYLKKPKLYDLANREIVDYEYKDTVIKTMSFDYKRKIDIVDQLKIFQSDIVDYPEYFKSKKIKIIMGNTPYSNAEFMDTVFCKLKSLDKEIEVISIGEYTNKLVFNGIDNHK